jgi:hypothetical protein
MKFNIIETINTVSWSEGTQNAPAELVTKAKAMADEGKPATFGKIEATQGWVVLSVDETNNQIYVALRG